MMLFLLILGCVESGSSTFDDVWPGFCPFTPSELLDLAEVVEIPNTTDSFDIVREVEDLRVTAWSADLRRFRFDLDEDTVEGLDELLLNSTLWYHYPDDVPPVEDVDLVGCDLMGWRGEASIAIDKSGTLFELEGALTVFDEEGASLVSQEGGGVGFRPPSFQEPRWTPTSLLVGNVLWTEAI